MSRTQEELDELCFELLLREAQIKEKMNKDRMQGTSNEIKESGEKKEDGDGEKGEVTRRWKHKNHRCLSRLPKKKTKKFYAIIPFQKKEPLKFHQVRSAPKKETTNEIQKSNVKQSRWPNNLMEGVPTCIQEINYICYRGKKK